MVMPRSRSMSIRSRYWALACRGSSTPVSRSIWSASVDLPWSMWAMIEKLRMRSGGVSPGWAGDRGHGLLSVRSGFAGRILPWPRRRPALGPRPARSAGQDVADRRLSACGDDLKYCMASSLVAVLSSLLRVLTIHIGHMVLSAKTARNSTVWSRAPETARFGAFSRPWLGCRFGCLRGRHGRVALHLPISRRKRWISGLPPWSCSSPLFTVVAPIGAPGEHRQRPVAVDLGLHRQLAAAADLHHRQSGCDDRDPAGRRRP